MFRNRIFVFLAVLAVLTAVSANCCAQDDTPMKEETFAVSGASAAQEMSIKEGMPATEETADEEVGVGTLEGTIKAIDQNELTFKLSYPITFEFEELTFAILPMTEIIKNMNDADFFEIQVGDRAIVDYIDDSSNPLKAVRVTLVGDYEE